MKQEHERHPSDFYFPVEDMYYKMIEEVEDYAIIMLDTNGYIRTWNKGAEKIKGYTESEIIGKSFQVFYPKEDQKNGLPQRLLELGRKTGKAHHEGWRVRKDGSSFWGSIVITALHNNGGDVVGFTKVTRDLTQKKLADDRAKAVSQELATANEHLLQVKQHLEQNIKELNRVNEELQQYAYITSHDLKEPLRKAKTYFSRLFAIYEHSFDEQGLELIKKINSSITRMQTLIDDLLAISAISEDMEFVPVDLNEVVKNALEDLEIRITEKNARITVATLPAVRGDKTYLVQLFINLLSNSLKFCVQQPVIDITSASVGNYGIISVQDNGIGIEEKYLQKIFHVFQRLHPRGEYEGTGIGLAICKKIIDIHHGNIQVKSSPGMGTEFVVTLPLA